MRAAALTARSMAAALILRSGQRRFIVPKKDDSSFSEPVDLMFGAEIFKTFNTDFFSKGKNTLKGKKRVETSRTNLLH